MYIETKNIKKAKEILFEEFTDNLNKCNSLERKYLINKYNHSYDCLGILKKIHPIIFFKYAPSILLHDIGRFSEYNSLGNFDHAKYGYNLLKSYYIKDPLVLLPIKYHEDDLDWYLNIQKDREYLLCSKIKRKRIIKSCCLVRDIDIISNMKTLAINSISNDNIEKINLDLVIQLKNKNISIRDNAFNEYDEIVYILCGLGLITFDKSFSYLKKNRIVEKLITKLFCLIGDNDTDLYQNTLEIKKIIYDKYGL